MKGEYISIETLKMYQEIEKENKELQEENKKLKEEVKRLKFILSGHWERDNNE